MKKFGLKTVARNSFIQGKVADCRKAGSIVFEIDESRKGGITAADMVRTLGKYDIEAMASSVGGSSIWKITAAVAK